MALSIDKSCSVLLESHPRSGGRSWLFRDPVEVLCAASLSEVKSVLDRAEDWLGRGCYAAGYLSYEAAPAFDSAMTVCRADADFPLVWLGVYRQREALDSARLTADGSFVLSDWQASISPDAYRRAIDRIRKYIASGDTYQVNFTFRMRARFAGDAWTLYRRLVDAQQSAYCAYLDIGRFKIVSASPELFFRLSGPLLETRPMKGTATRGRWSEEDERFRRWLADSSKDRAENVMIVDLLRNDMSKISERDSVTVAELYHVERYPTVFQMTSTVRSRTSAPIATIMTALFPCGSVTGAPKIRTMQIIAEQENSPRGLYTGAIGFMGPDHEAQFNVAIRTITIDGETELAEYGVGGGVTWGSTVEKEYEECLVKAQVLFEERPAFELLESLLYEADKGFFLLDRHLRRLADSARYFGFDCDPGRVRSALDACVRDAVPGLLKVRLRVSNEGKIQTEAISIDAASPVVRLGLAREPVSARAPLLFHKTTSRRIYDQAKASRSDCDDVALWNERGEVTETSIANIVVEDGNGLFTPPLDSGLLPGTFRAELVETGRIQERVLYPDDLKRAKRLYVVNSVRRWVDAQWMG